MALLCERHATSKSRAFEDLASCTSFGFRGEALASMSFVSRLSVTTMTSGAICALRATYCDGVLEAPPRPCAGASSSRLCGGRSLTLPAAGVLGTTVSVEDLFYNVVTRRKALKSAAEEYSRVLEVVQRYSLLRTDVTFSVSACVRPRVHSGATLSAPQVRKSGEARADLHVSTPSGATVADRVRAVFGAALARELVPFEACAGSEADNADAPAFSATGLVSSPAYAAKRGIFILFINGRLVDCVLLRRALEAVHSASAPKPERPWMFVSLRMPSAHVDVNVHPTKAEVAFLHADAVAAACAEALATALAAANAVRTFAPGTATLPALAAAQAQLPSAMQPRVAGGDAAGGTQRERAGGDHKLVRTDARAGTLDAFVQMQAGGEATLNLARAAVRQRRSDPPAAQRPSPSEPAAPDVSPPEPACELTSVSELLAEAAAGSHAGLAEVLRRHTWVGLARGSWVLLQHGTKLYMAAVPRLSSELFRQRVLHRFGRSRAMRLEPPAPLVPLLLEALNAAEARGEWREVHGSKQAIARKLAQLLLVKGPMLTEYFSLALQPADADAVGTVCALPELLEGHTPCLSGLPELLLRLGNDTDWDREKPCFAAVAQHLGDMYALQLPAAGFEQRHEWVVQHVLLPAMRSQMHPPAVFASDGTFMQVACLEQLYRVFERC